MKDAKRKFLKNFIKFLPAIGLASLAFPGFRLMEFSSGTNKKVKIKISDLEYEVNKIDNFFVIREGENFKALSAVCTHLGCILNYDDLNKNFLCPCHRSKFDLSGNVLQSPASKPLNKLKLVKDKDFLVVYS